MFKNRLKGEQLDEIAGNRPTVPDVINTVIKACSTWDEKRRKGKYGITKQYFHQFCAGLHSHATMLELLPAGNEYVCLFTGTISTIVKASVNHEKIAHGLSKSLCEITDVVNQCVEMCRLYNTKDVQMLIAKLYAHIFLFLKDVMSWFIDKHWKRILNSLREDFYSDFEEQVANIRQIAAQVKHRADMGASAEQRVTRISVEETRAELADLRSDLRLFLGGYARDKAEIAYAMNSLDRKARIEEQQKQTLKIEATKRSQRLADFIAADMTELLLEQAEGSVASKSRDFAETEMSRETPATFMVQEVQPVQNESRSQWGRENYLVASRHLELYFDRDHIREPFEVSPNLAVPSRISYRLREFVTGSGERLCAIAGSHKPDHQGMSIMTKVAGSFIAHAESLDLPVVSWFCRLHEPFDEQSGISVQEKALISLLYALLRQLIEILPLVPKCPIDIDAADFEKLDGTVATTEIALRLLQQLLDQVDSPLFIVVDGLQWLDDVSTDTWLKGLVETLMQEWASSSQGRLSVRTLLTTTGRSAALLEVLYPDAYTLADEGGHTRRARGANPMVW